VKSGPKPRPQADRLWEKVDKNGPIHPVLGTACWLWMAGRNKLGYGLFDCGSAHRIAWILTNGPPPPDTPFVLHRCDNPPCCNPDHHFLGTQADNIRDMVAKGRARGPTAWTAAECADLYAIYSVDYRYRELVQFAAGMGRHISNVVRQARKMGLTRADRHGAVAI